jgi:hypothetical protein
MKVNGATYHNSDTSRQSATPRSPARGRQSPRIKIAVVHIRCAVSSRQVSAIADTAGVVVGIEGEPEPPQW